MRNLIRRKQRGQSVVEFALVATLFITLVIGLFSIVDVIHVKTVADNAVREGGRRAIFAYDGTAEAKQLMDDMMRENKTLMGATCISSFDGPYDSGSIVSWLLVNQSITAKVDCEVPVFLLGQSIFGRPTLKVHSQATFNVWDPGIVIKLLNLG